MKTYKQVKQAVFATGTIPDGYSGDLRKVGVAFLDNTAVFVADCGYFRAGLPDGIDENEALCLLNKRGDFRTL